MSSKWLTKNLGSLLALLLIGANWFMAQGLFAEAIFAGYYSEPPWAAVLSMFLMGCFLFFTLTPPSLTHWTYAYRWPYPPRPLVGSWWRWSGFVLVIGLTQAILWMLFQLNHESSYLIPFTLWVITVGVYVAICYVSQETKAKRPWWNISRPGIFWPTLLLFVAAFVLRVWQLGSVPYVLSGDEASQGLEAIRVLEGEIRNPFSTGWLGVPTLSFFFNSFTIHWFGRTAFALRLPWVILGLCTVMFTFQLLYETKGVRWAWLTAGLLATYHYHIHYSRLGSNQIADPFFLISALYFVYRGLKKEESWSWAAAGLVTGLAFYFYAGARLTVVVVLATVAYHWFQSPHRFWARHKWHLAMLLGGILVAGAPMFQYAYRFPDDFNARINAVGIIQNGWLEQELAIPGNTLFTVLGDQFKRAFLAFNYYTDRTVWYGLKQPLLSAGWGALFLLGLFYSTFMVVLRRDNLPAAGLVIWWWAGMMLGGVLTESPPSSQRLITLAVPTCYMLALALMETGRLISSLTQRWLLNVWLLSGVTLFALFSLHLYFVEFTPQRLAGGPRAEVATILAPYLAERKDTHHFYLIGEPMIFWGFSTWHYLVPDMVGLDIKPEKEVLEGPLLPLTIARSQKGAVFIIWPEYEHLIPLIQEKFPEGETLTFVSPVYGQTQVYLYILTP